MFRRADEAAIAAEGNEKELAHGVYITCRHYIGKKITIIFHSLVWRGNSYMEVAGELLNDEEGIGYGVVGADVLLVQVVYPAVQGQLPVGHSLA